jgi:hypothetical protein
MVGHLPTEALVFYAGDVPTPGGTQNERLVNSYAKPPRVVPITRLVAEKVVILRDAAGGEMVLLDAEPRTAVITSTWAAWVGVVDHAGQLVARGIKGSDFLKAIQQCELDLVMHDGDADAAKLAAVVHAAPDQAPRALTEGALVTGGAVQAWVKWVYNCHRTDRRTRFRHRPCRPAT